MISMPRSWARDLRAVFRRLNPSRRYPQLAVELSVQNNVLRAHCVGSEGAAEFCHASEQDSSSAIVPLDALADCEGKDPSPVTFDALSDRQVETRWTQNGVPQVRTYVAPEQTPSFPEPPTDWTRNPLELLDALEEAVESTAASATRYALDHIQFKGSTGEVVASDGKQLLIQGGYAFSWPDDVLVSRTGTGAARAIGRVDAVHVGRHDGYLWLRTGPWSLVLRIDTVSRFPDVHAIIPSAKSDTRLVLDPRDAETLAAVLPDLPGAEKPFAPVTVDLNGRVAIRAQASDHGQATELVLDRSQILGKALRFVIDRRHLSRACQLGFRTIQVVASSRPIVWRNGQHMFVAMPLDEKLGIPPTDGTLLVNAIAVERPATSHATESCAPIVAIAGPVNATARTSPSASGSIDEAIAIQTELSHLVNRVRGLSTRIRQEQRQHTQLQTRRTARKRLLPVPA